MKRGDVVIVCLPGDYGKPRPAVIVQNDPLNAAGASIIVCPLTSHLVDAPSLRVDIAPTPRNGLRRPSQVMADKIMTLDKRRIGKVIGRLTAEDMHRVDAALLFVLALTDPT